MQYLEKKGCAIPENDSGVGCAGPGAHLSKQGKISISVSFNNKRKTMCNS